MVSGNASKYSFSVPRDSKGKVDFRFSVPRDSKCIVDLTFSVPRDSKPEIDFRFFSCFAILCNRLHIFFGADCFKIGSWLPIFPCFAVCNGYLPSDRQLCYNKAAVYSPELTGRICRCKSISSKYPLEWKKFPLLKTSKISHRWDKLAWQNFPFFLLSQKVSVIEPLKAGIGTNWAFQRL